MSTIHPVPRRGVANSSHLRNVGNDQSSALSNHSRASTPSAPSSSGTVIRDIVERRVQLSVHDDYMPDKPEREDILINLDLVGDSVKPGDVLEIVALKTDSGVWDFQENISLQKKDADNLGLPIQRERSGSNPKAPSDSAFDSHYDVDPDKRFVFVVKDMSKEQKEKKPRTEISVGKHIADAFGFKNRSTVLLRTTNNSHRIASHVEISFKEQYLSRSDMWRLVVEELSDRTVYTAQKITFLSTIRAAVTSVYVNGSRVNSAFFSTNTKPIFRSESARFILFVQMSREMWDFDSEGSGEIMFNKVVNGVLPAIFKRWAAMKAKHLVSIVMFTRVEYETSEHSKLGEHVMDHDYHTGQQTDGNRKPYKDFYRVVVSDMASGEWTTILTSLKREFRFFRRDISMHRLNKVGTTSDSFFEGHTMGSVPGTRIEAEPSLACRGNLLEAINLASTQFSHDHIDRDLCRTGISVVVITPSVGVFEVDYELLKSTTESLAGNGIGIDLICLPKMPLHSVPLFKYRNPQYAAYQEALRMKSITSEDNTPRQNIGIFGSYQSMNERLSPSKSSGNELSQSRSMPSVYYSKIPNEWSFAIPHWIDGSYWTGASQDIGSRPGVRAARVPVPTDRYQAAHQPREFEVRCRMYEMAISNIIGNGLAEISVPALQIDPAHPLSLAKRADLLASLETEKTTETHKPYAALMEPPMGPSRSAFERTLNAPEKEFYKTIEEFEANIAACAFNANQNSVSYTARKAKLEETRATRKALAEDPEIFGTSFKDADSTTKGASLVAAAMNARLHDVLPQTTTVSRKNRLDSVSSAVSANNSLVSAAHVKPPKVSRQISLGFRGFAVGAPKTAVAAIQIEHANAVKSPGSASSEVEDHKLSSSKIASHLSASSTPTKAQARPSSSQSNIKSTGSDRGSEKGIGTRDLPTMSLTEPTLHAISKPIPIKSALQSLESNNTYRSRPALESLFEALESQADVEETQSINGLSGAATTDTQKIYKSKLLANSIPDVPVSLSPTTALSPWLSVLNPSNPSVKESNTANQYRRWQHVHPRPINAKTMKWKSLCSPASVPLTTEYFPTRSQLSTEYKEKPYNISQNFDEDLEENPASRDDFLRELIAARLAQGFQIVIGPAVANAFGQASMKIANTFSKQFIAEDGTSIFMSMGSIIHQLSCINETEVNVHTWIRKPATDINSNSYKALSEYKPGIRTTLAEDYDPRHIPVAQLPEEYNWNYVDSFIAGHEEEMNEHLRFWRARFVLIPVQRPMQQYHKRQGEDNEEEIRLEGIRKLTQLWQRHRYIPPSERKFTFSRKPKDPNPLDIVYQTQDPSAVVALELETLPLVEGDLIGRRGQLFSEGERFRKSSFNIAALADAIQATVDRGGVRMQNRRWHFRLHYNCFIGSDMTTWLLENFEDIETREEAVDFGNQLMRDEEAQRVREKEREFLKEAGKDPGKDSITLFVHVEKRHPFRDGQYFYQITGDYAKPRPDSRSGWFGSRRRDNSVPSTPMSERPEKDFPRSDQSRTTSGYEEKSSDSGTSTPHPGAKRPRVALSKMMKYDVDSRRKSYRPERINLHYDRLHNPDNCYHIRIDWMNVTPKLIEDTIQQWAQNAERYGLRLVEAPINEASSITELHPFRSPYEIRCVVPPPDHQPETSYFTATSFAPQQQHTRQYYHKAILKKFNFVLDIEAARNFPSNVDVYYSWGKPDYKYSQYIHRSGVVLVQITDEGNFLLLANRLYNNRVSGIKDHEKFVKTDLMDRGGRMSSAGGGASSMYDIRPPGFPFDRTPTSSPMIRPHRANELASPRIQPATGAQIMPVIGPVSSDVLGPAALRECKLSNFTTPESIKNNLEAFCADASALEPFYKETLEKAQSQTPPIQPKMRADLLPESNIPIIGLPPSVLMRGGGNGTSGTSYPAGLDADTIPGIGESLREQSPARGSHSMRFVGGGFHGGPVRRGSWHPSDVFAGSMGSTRDRESHSGAGSGSGGKDSPRGSIGEGRGKDSPRGSIAEGKVEGGGL